jgi:hypothetical protein
MAAAKGWATRRGQNADVINLGNVLTQFQHANPDVLIPYVRY